MITSRSYHNLPLGISIDNPREKCIFVIVPTVLEDALHPFLIAMAMTIEKAKEYMLGLQDNSRPELWNSFFQEESIYKRMKIWLNASCLAAHYSIDDLAHALYVHSITVRGLIPTELKKDIEDETGRKKTPQESSCLPAYFSNTIKHLLWNPGFLLTSFGIPLKLYLKKTSIDEVPEGGTPMSERIPSKREQEIAEAKEDVNDFKLVIKMVEDRYPNKPYGELLRRYYLPPIEEAREIAIDFLRRGLIKVANRTFTNDSVLSEEMIEAATDNVQNRKLAYARAKFNEIALSNRIDLRLSGKIKKSILKDI
jgi:hypothetical protein